MLAYFRLVLKERLKGFIPLSAHRAGESKGKAIAKYVGFAVLFLVLYASIIGFEYFVFWGLSQIGQAQSMLAIAFLLCTMLVLLLSFFYIFSMLFFSKDIAFASALPISSRGILSVKLGMVLLEETAIAMLICLPIIIMYGVHTGAGLLLYVKMILFVPFLPFIPVALITLLSFGLIRVSGLWKRREGVTTFATMLLVLGIVGAEMFFSMSMSDEEMTQWIMKLLLTQQGMVDWFVRIFPPIGWLCDAFLRAGAGAWLQGLLFAAVSVGAVALAVGALGGGYQTLAVQQSEVMTRLNAQGKKDNGKQKVHSPLAALYRKEMKEIFVVNAYATNCLAPLIMFPLIVLIMMLGIGNYMEEGMPLINELLARMPRLVYFAVMSLALAFTTTMNMATSTAVSREGKRRYFSKIIPVASSTQLMAKLLMGMTLTGATIIATAAIMCAFLPMFWLETLGAAVVAMAFGLLLAAGGLILDVYRPWLNWKTEAEAVKRNMNGMLAMLGSMVVVALFAGAYFGIVALGGSSLLAVIAVLALLVVLDILIMKWLVGKASITYCLQEKFS